MDILVTKRDGTQEPFDASMINRSIEDACAGLPDAVSMVVQIGSETSLMLYSGITTEELDMATINAALQNIQDDPNYDHVATRLLAKTVYKRVIGTYGSQEELAAKHQSHFPAYVKEYVAHNILDARMIEKFDLEKLAEALKISRDELFGFAGISTLLDRYAIKDQSKKAIETPQYFFMRIAMGLSYNEENPTQAAINFYDRMSQHEYFAGGSTNIGSGTTRPALSNCFLIQVEDDIEHIAKSVSDVIRISKATGGLGVSVTKLRASGSLLSSSNTASSGPTPFAKIMDVAIRAIQRGGKKVGALCFYMENWHLDFPEFLMWKHNAGDDHLRMRTADTAVFLSDEFMKRVQNGDDWYMFDPKDTPDLIELYGAAFSKRYAEYVKEAEAGKIKMVKKVKAEDQWRQILVMLESTSHPWITWKDAMNVRALNNNTGTIHMSNLCTEICLPQDRNNVAVCNLASINLLRHLENGAVNYTKLEATVRAAVRHLDNLIDINVLPIEEAIRSDAENRAVGLGVMGMSEVVELLKYSYDSEESYNLADKLFEFISYMAIDESANLAQVRGSYKNFPGSGWSKGMVPIDTLKKVEDDRGQQLTVSKISHAEELSINWDTLRKKVMKGMRNATLMAVAPNANIGLLGDTTPGIDPRFAQVFSRNKFSGKYMDINHNLVNDLKELGLWEKARGEILKSQGDISEISSIPEHIRKIYTSAFTVSPYAFIEIAARAQKWVDQALSRNIYLETRNIDDIMNVYKTAWEKGLKTTYYLHMKPRHTAEQSTVTVNKAADIGKRGFGALSMSAAPAIATATVTVDNDEGVVVAVATAAAPTTSSVTVASAEPFMCPIDPAERAQCDSCQ